MEFKIGQKVRIKRWNDMPEDVFTNWGLPSYIGEVGKILRKTTSGGYAVCFSEKQYGLLGPPEAFYFSQELEPLIKVGEQLLFDFIKE